MKQDLEKLLNERVSLRRYASREIDKEDLDFILRHTMRAPTAGNMMLYSVIKVTDEAVKKKLSVTCDDQPFISKAPLILVFCADFQRWYDYYEASGVPVACRKRGEDYHLPEEGEFMLGMMDATIASSYATIAAEACGVGTCYIGDIIENYEIHREMFDLPKWVLPVGMLCLGYYPDNFKRSVTSRFDEKFVVFDETYRRFSPAELKEMLAEREEKLPSKNQYNAENYGQFNYFRKTGTAFSDEMTRSVKVMLESWKDGV